MSRVLGDVFQILNGNVGLGTTIPRQLLDIQDGNGIISGNLGIGTINPQYAIDANGDINFTGILRQSGTPYISSQWTTSGADIYYSSGNVGIQTSTPLYTLDINGSLRALNVFASNLTVLGDTTILNTISSNTEQMVITNTGTGPALKVTQSGINSVAEFYDNESGLALMIANNGNIGIGSTTPYNALDINGNMYINGTITTNNNNINAGSGTVTATTFSGTATQVSQNLTRGTYLTGANYNGSVATTWAVDADTAATANKVVARDASAYIFASGVGIGTATARQLLDVQGGHAIISGNLGIGTTNPTVRLSVGTGPSDVTSTLMFNSGDTATNTDKLYWTYIKNGSRIGHNAGWNVNHYAGQSNTSAAPSNGNFHFFTGGPEYNERLTILNNGNIGIGSTQPAYRLDVAGNAYINGAITTNNNNINAGTGTVTAATFSGTATKVSNDLVRGSYLTGTNYNGAGTTTWAVDATSTNTANKVVVRDASGNFSAGTITATLNGTATQVSQDLVKGTYLTGTNYNGSETTEWAVDADSANTANKVVVRDASGNFSAGTITATLSGIATQVSQYLNRGSYLIGNNYNGSVATTWAVDADTAATANKVVVRDASGNFSAGTITATLSGTATQVSQDLSRGTYLIGDNYNGSVATTWAVDADTAATANKVVVRDASGMIYAANIGIGTTSALYAVDVIGDVNFTGILRENGTPYISSQWTTSGLNIYYSTGNVGIGTNDPLNYSLNINGDSYLKKVATSNFVFLQEPNAYFQITPIRKVYYIETASESIFNITVVGIYGGVASNIQCFVNNNLLSYYSSNIKDYDISYTHSTPSNLTTYTITLTSPANYGSIVDITVTPQIITETDLSNNLFYQNISVYTTYFNQYGNNIAYTNGNVGIGTTVIQNTGGGLHIIAPEGPDTNGACAQLIVENGATDVGGADEDARIIIKSKQAGESDLIMYNIDDSVISWGKIGWLGNTIYLQTGTTDAVNDATDVARLNENICYFPSANVGIGTTNPDVRLLVGANTMRDEVIKVNSQGFAGLILNGDTANTTGEVGGAYIWFRADAAATTATIALNQIAGENGRGGTLTGSTANALVLSHANNYPIQFGINGQVLMEVDTDASIKLYTTDNIFCGEISTVTAADNLYVYASDILYLESLGTGTGNTVRSSTVYNSVTASAANVFVTAAGTLQRSSSSLRYKKDVTTLEDSIADNILNCRSVKYKSINPKEVPLDWTYYGFIAEEVALIEPRLVTYDLNNEPDGVQYDRFIPLLLNIIQRQQTRIQTLESTVQQLQSDYNNLIQTLQNKNILP